MRNRLLLSVVVFCSLFLVVQCVSAQQNCKAFRAIVQARLYVPLELPPVTSPPPPYQFGWSGPFAGTLDSAPVIGFLSYAEEPKVDFPPPGPNEKGKAGKETNVIFKLDFTSGKTGSFKTVKDWGVFPVPPGQGIGNYLSTAKIDPTTGTLDFQGASGFFTVAGPAFGPIAPTSILQFAFGVWSPEVSGKICFGQ